MTPSSAHLPSASTGGSISARCISGFFAAEHPDLFEPLTGSLLHHDQYVVLTDYRSCVSCQERVSVACRDAQDWPRMSILDVARMSRFQLQELVR